jgi:hypothetical protein
MTRLRLLCFALLASFARADIEFVGILATSESTRFALGDTTTGKTGWVKKGDEFGGYTIAAFDAKQDTLLLRRDGAELRIKLKDDAKVQFARIELTGTITFGATEKIAIERATLLFDQENIFPLKDGITYRITPQRLPDGTILYQTSIERVVAANKTERLSSPAVITLPGQQFSLQIDDLGFSFKPR